MVFTLREGEIKSEKMPTHCENIITGVRRRVLIYAQWFRAFSPGQAEAL